MTKQNFPHNYDISKTMFAWAIRSDAEDVVEAVEYTPADSESGIQLQALIAMAEA